MVRHVHLCNGNRAAVLWQCTNYRRQSAPGKRRTAKLVVMTENGAGSGITRQKKPSLISTRVENRSDDTNNCALQPWGNELALQKIPWRSREYHTRKIFATDL